MIDMIDHGEIYLINEIFEHPSIVETSIRTIGFIVAVDFSSKHVEISYNDRSMIVGCELVTMADFRVGDLLTVIGTIERDNVSA